jgi:UDP-glucose:(heptosyl)LPS alpha-1,3-glucosyltransferase
VHPDVEDMMKLAFCLFKYYPFGGLERDFLRTVQLCIARGHEVHILTMHWQGEIPLQCKVTFIPVAAWTNHGRAKQFSQKVFEFLHKQHFDVVVGFNRMAGLDVYIQADMCYQSQMEKRHSAAWYRLLPRHYIYTALERAVFSPKAYTQILLLNTNEKAEFVRHYQTPLFRFHDVPPGVGADRKRPDNQLDIRNNLRKEMRVQMDGFVALLVGSDFARKGVDRAIRALASLDEPLRNKTSLWVVGDGDSRHMQRLATKLHVAKKVVFFGAREDVVRFYAAADLLIHPAYHENTGTILIEALVAGLPVLVTANCGYATYIQKAQAGLTVSEPFLQMSLNQRLRQLLNRETLNHYRENALRYASTHDLFHLTEFVVEAIENAAKK